jgi:hypothetical protein
MSDHGFQYVPISRRFLHESAMGAFALTLVPPAREPLVRRE